MAAEADAARERVLAARTELATEVERLQASARAAVDIPAKVRRHPAQVAAAVGGVGFVALGGPRRLFRRVKSAIVGPDQPLPESMLPEEVEKTLRRLGTDGERVRGTLERDFADYLKVSQKRRGPALAPDDLLRGHASAHSARRKARSGLAPAAGSARCARSKHSAAGCARAETSSPTSRRLRTWPRTRRQAPARLAPGEWRNGRRAGLRSRCRVSGVSVRVRPRLPSGGWKSNA